MDGKHHHLSPILILWVQIVTYSKFSLRSKEIQKIKIQFIKFILTISKY